MRSAPRASKWLYMLLSVLIAIVFWLFVRTSKNPDMTNRVRDIPVTVTGSQLLEESKSLMIDTVSADAVSLTWQGKWSDIRQLDKDSVSVTVDTSRISEPGTYELNYTVNYPSTVSASALTLQSSDPAQITVTVSKIYSSPFAVHPVLTGNIAPGFQAEDFLVEPESVLISGTQEKVDRISQVRVVLEANGLSETFAGDLPLTLLDADGMEIDHSGLRFSTEEIYVVLPVVMTKEIPLKIEFVAGGGATENNIEYEINPKTITVSGAPSEIRNLTEVRLGSINLAQVMSILDKEYPVYLPAGVENVSGITTANVWVSVEGLMTKEFEISDIQVVNVPEGYTAKLTTEVTMVVLRGTENALGKVEASQIRMVADLEGVATTTGSYNVPVKIYLFADNDVGVVGQNNVVINLSKTPEGGTEGTEGTVNVVQGGT